MARAMGSLADRLRARIAPAALTALGVSFVAAGLLTYSGPVDAGPVPPPSATISPAPSPAAPSALPTVPPLSPAPSASLAPGEHARYATRVAVPALGIDLPVIRQPDADYPACDVAMYLEELFQPGEPGATYLYAHARVGMFLPILDASRVNDGARMIGMLAQVFTSDDRLYLYEVVEVRRHQTSLDDAFAATASELWLQTSEGPRAPDGVVSPKTQLVARLLSSGPADPAEAHPTPHPIACG